jgi:hypothetical protein
VAFRLLRASALCLYSVVRGSAGYVRKPAVRDRHEPVALQGETIIFSVIRSRVPARLRKILSLNIICQRQSAAGQISIARAIISPSRFW